MLRSGACWVAADDRDELQAELAELRDPAPAVPFKDLQRVIGHELGDQTATLFAQSPQLS